MDPIRILIVDDHAVVRKGIQMIVDTDPTIEVVGEAKDGEQALFLVGRLKPEIVLMDLVMPSGDGIEATAAIKRDYPHTAIIVLTTFEDDYRIQAALEAGADGYLLKDADGEALLMAIKAVQRGEMPLHPRVAHHLFAGRTGHSPAARTDELTEREKDVLKLIARGLTNKEAAEALTLSEGTIKAHVSRILGKLGVSSRTEAAMLAVQLGLISIDADPDSHTSHLA